MNTALDQLIPPPRSLDLDHVDLAALPTPVRELIRHENLARSPLQRALFAPRTLSRAPGLVVRTRRITEVTMNAAQPSVRRQVLEQHAAFRALLGHIIDG